MKTNSQTQEHALEFVKSMAHKEENVRGGDTNRRANRCCGRRHALHPGGEGARRVTPSARTSVRIGGGRRPQIDQVYLGRHTTVRTWPAQHGSAGGTRKTSGDHDRRLRTDVEWTHPWRQDQHYSALSVKLKIVDVKLRIVSHL
jgi:hypothetical protein